MEKMWQTYCERSGFTDSPGYDESISYFKQFEKKSPYAKMFSIGTSPQGRSIECLIVAKGMEFTPEKAKHSGKAIILIQNGIHAGEIEGKDACMLLVRDILVTKQNFDLLDHLILLIIPVLSVDGHERTSEFNRPNQNGPLSMGWRTNSWNLNLNRDYVKADTPEIQSFLRLFNTWLPDFFIDNHTTNGADYQYHITYSLERQGNIDSYLSKFGKQQFLPSIIRSVESKGFLTAPYIQMKNDTLDDGIVETPSLPRLSTGYAAIQNRLALLVETHSLKPFENRVHSTVAMNYAALEFINKNYKTVRLLNQQADDRAKNLGSIPIIFELSEKARPFIFKGYKSEYALSPITGEDVVQYSQEPIQFVIPYFDSIRVARTIKVPKTYIIPKEFESLIPILELHGIVFNRLTVENQMNVEQYVFEKQSIASRPYEGRMCITVKCRTINRTLQFPRGTYIVNTMQRSRRVIVHLLEPEAPDSFVSWGFFNAFLERKEYAEAYVMEPIARRMLETNKKVRDAFLKNMDAESFQNNPQARLDFFYQRSPYFDMNENKYPIFRSR